MSIPIEVSETLPLSVYWIDTARSDLIVFAQVYQRNPYQLLEADLPMNYIPGSPAIYQNTSLIMPDTDVVDVRYDVYDSDGTTLLMSGDEVFVKGDTDGGGGGSSVGGGQAIAGVVISSSVVRGTVRCEIG